MFIELWQGLRDLMHDNNTSNSIADSKLFINWTLRDLANEYDWEFLRGTINLTATAGSGTYILNPISQVSATATTIYAQSNATADGGQIIRIFGKQILSGDVDYTTIMDSITLIATATASGSSVLSHIDSIQKLTTSGTIRLTTSGGTIIATLTTGDIYLANDISKLNMVIDQTNDRVVQQMDYSTYQKGNPDDSNLNDLPAYDIDYLGNIRLMNISSNNRFLFVYQRIPKYLINNIDRTEFPYQFYSKIINAAYHGYGLRYQDEQDGQIGKARYQELLREIIASWRQGKDIDRSRIIPSWYKRTI